jgi:hypothetical protein
MSAVVRLMCAAVSRCGPVCMWWEALPVGMVWATFAVGLEFASHHLSVIVSTYVVANVHPPQNLDIHMHRSDKCIK